MVAVAPTRHAVAPGSKPYVPYGGALAIMRYKGNEAVLSGPAGTGKSRACLEKLYIAANNYPGMRALMVRKTRESLTQGAMVTFEQKVLPEGTPVFYHGGDHEYRFPNGSVIVVGGLDKASKVMSTEYDMVYVQEATELTENDWESLSTRLRNGVMPYQQIIGDCNPDAPTHWLRTRADRGALLMLESRHEDNPTVTPEYLAKLDALTGVRYLRLRRGIWAAAEGMVYEEYDPAAHLIDRFDIPAEWPRFWSVDFGYTNPFVWHAYAQDGDGRLYRYKEIYMTGRLVEDHARDILAATRGESRPQRVYCDHDAEGRATLDKYLGLKTTPANKAITAGIQSVQARLRKQGDGKTRLYLMRDSLVERDPVLVEKRLPTSTEEEVPGYVWNVTGGRKKGEEPVDKDNHGMDTLRYMVHTMDAPQPSRKLRSW